MTTATAETQRGNRVELRLDLEGMTCASCAARIEKSLNALGGIDATVNFATEQASVQCGADVPVAQLLAAVESVGYVAHQAKPAHEAQGHGHRDAPLAALRRRLGLAAVLTLPVALLAMVPSLRFAGWEWLALALSAPVVFYSGSAFHRAALQNARHRAPKRSASSRHSASHRFS